MIDESRNPAVRRVLRVALTVALVLNPFLLLWQWGDFGDSGYTVSMAQNFAVDAARGDLKCEFFLTLAIGYGILQFAPGIGLLGFFSVGAALVVVSSFAPLFALGRKYRSSLTAIVAVFAAQCFLIRGWQLFDYDMVSIAFLTWSAAFALRGVYDRHYAFLFLAGLLIVPAALARLPGVLGLSLVIVPFFAHLVSSRNSGTSERFYDVRGLSYGLPGAGIFLGGFVCGLLLAWASLAGSGMLTVYTNGLGDLVGLSRTSGSHGFSKLFGSYLLDAQRLLWPSMVVAVVWTALAVFLLGNSRHPLLMWSFVLLTVVLVACWIGARPPSHRHAFKYLVPAFFLPAGLLVLLLGRGVDSVVRGMILAGICVGVSSMAGSATGFLKFMSGMFFILPGVALGFASLGLRQSKDSIIPWRRLGVAAMLVVLVGSLATRALRIYGTPQRPLDRLSYVHPVNVPRLKGLRTSDSRAGVLEDAFRTLAKFEPSSKLYVYGLTPILYFATGRHAFVNQLWLGDDMYTAEDVVSALKNEMKRTGELPIFAVTDRNILGSDSWPRIKSFLREHDYVLRSAASGIPGFSLEVYAPETTPIK